MSQLIFKFPFKTTYFEKDYFVSTNNFEAYKLIESLPKWPDKKINIFGPSGCGKTHLTNILSKKLKLLIINANKFNEKINNLVENFDCVVIENYEENINENLIFCEYCKEYFPRDFYHCIDCGCCIERLDHHCPWIGRCIGAKNMKYFIRFNILWITEVGFVFMILFQDSS